MGNNITVKIKKLTASAKMPIYATDGSGCFDLYYSGRDSHVIRPINDTDKLGAKVLNTGLAFEIPKGYVMAIFSRSGHGFNHDVRLSNCVGIIDSDYRGEVLVKLIADQEPLPNKLLIIDPGDRIAQAMIIESKKVTFLESGELSETDRGSGGFGHTGS